MKPTGRYSDDGGRIWHLIYLREDKMDKPPIIDEVAETIKFLESLMRDPREQIDPRWFLPYECDEKPKLKLIKGENDEQD